jgi:hypothetical protein
LAQAVGWHGAFILPNSGGELGWDFQHYLFWCSSFSRRPNSAREKTIFRSHAAGEFGLLSYMECDADIDEVASSVTIGVKT